jgi:hypothetical protein
MAAMADFSVVISLGDRRFTYNSADGEDLGNYEGEFVRQRCIRVMRRDTALTVYFRPDVELDRLEVVVELGRCWLADSEIKAAHIIEPYSCEILHAGKVIAVVNVPVHFWWSRWRWQSAPRPVIRTAAQLREKKLVLPYGRSGLFGAPPTGRAIVAGGPMDSAGLDTAMASTGDRSEIGPFTEYQAEFLISGGLAALSSLLAQGEACGSMPIHWRDERTGAVVDVFQYPGLSCDSSGAPMLPAAENPGPVRSDRRLFEVDQSHTPSPAYLPYLLTDDPYFLEEMEGLATMAICLQSYHRRLYNRPGLVYLGQTRSFAWSIRTLFQLGAVAPEHPPKWLKNREYWRRCLADNHAVMKMFMASPAKIHRIFRAFPFSQFLSGWQNSFVAIALAMGVWMGFEEWREPYYWFIQVQTQMCNGKSGWSRQWPTPYYFHPVVTYEQLGAMGLVPDGRLDSVTASSWADAWEFFKKENKIDDGGWDGHTLMQNQTGPVYYLYLRASLAMATHLKVSEAKECYDYIAGELPGQMAKFHVDGNARWSIDPA